MKALPKVAIVGRPNVGKSTLFNRLAGGRRAIVHETSGVTRDVQRAETDWNGVLFIVIDTGGLFSGDKDSLTMQVEERALKAAFEADALIMVGDAKSGLTGVDEAVASKLRSSGLPILVCANKAERGGGAGSEFFKLGLGEVYEISALHGTGTGDMLDDLVSVLPKQGRFSEKSDLKIALIGKPNVGKSSVTNALIGTNVSIVHERPGTTRDSIDLKLKWQGRDLTLVDTAGVKRKSKNQDPVVSITALKSIEAVNRADVIVLMLDASQPVSNQDLKVGGYAHSAGKGILICLNKWDLIEKNDKTSKIFEDNIRDKFSFLSYAPILFISALAGQRIAKIMPLVWEIKEAREKKIRTSELNKILERVISANPPSYHAGGNGKIYYGTQTDSSPPRFSLFVNNAAFFDRSYIRYINNRLRDHFQFKGTRIRINLVGKKKGKS